MNQWKKIVLYIANKKLIKNFPYGKGKIIPMTESDQRLLGSLIYQIQKSFLEEHPGESFNEFLSKGIRDRFQEFMIEEDELPIINRYIERNKQASLKYVADNTSKVIILTERAKHIPDVTTKYINPAIIAAVDEFMYFYSLESTTNLLKGSSINGPSESSVNGVQNILTNEVLATLCNVTLKKILELIFQ